MYLIVGLGNPGQQYTGTRHNVGYMMLDHLARENNLSFTESKWKGLIARGETWDKPVLLIKPETFMNLSGMAVVQAANYYKITPEKIVVIHDDLDLDLGRIKMASGGGDGGHKGIRSIVEQLGTRDFARLKIGIGRPPEPVPPEKFVLGRFNLDEIGVVEKKADIVLEGLKLFLQQGIGAAMTIVNQRN